MGIEKKIISEKLNIELGYRKISEYIYNCNVGNIILTIGGYLNKEAYEEKGTEACLDIKKIILNTKKQIIKKPVMKPALNDDGSYKYEREGIIILEPSGEIVDERVNQESYINLESISLSLSEIYEFLRSYREFAG